MPYKLEFDPRAFKEWEKLDNTVKTQFKKKLANVLENPEILTNRLSDLPNCYKIKLRESGYRLVYQVQKEKISVLVIAIGKREKQQAYHDAKNRI